MGEYDVVFRPGVPADHLDAEGNFKPGFEEYNAEHNQNFSGFKGREITESVPPPPEPVVVEVAPTQTEPEKQEQEVEKEEPAVVAPEKVEDAVEVAVEGNKGRKK